MVKYDSEMKHILDNKCGKSVLQIRTKTFKTCGLIYK